MMRFLSQLLKDVRGVGAIEYALVASLIAVAGVAAFANLGNSVNNQYNSVEAEM